MDLLLVGLLLGFCGILTLTLSGWVTMLTGLRCVNLGMWVVSFVVACFEFCDRCLLVRGLLVWFGLCVLFGVLVGF